jgi:hypothetical protein
MSSFLAPSLSRQLALAALLYREEKDPEWGEYNDGYFVVVHFWGWRGGRSEKRRQQKSMGLCKYFSSTQLGVPVYLQNSHTILRRTFQYLRVLNWLNISWEILTSSQKRCGIINPCCKLISSGKSEIFLEV